MEALNPTPQDRASSGRPSAGLAELPDRTCIEVRGADRATLLHNLCTNEVKKRSPGDGFEAFFCDARGKIVGYAYLWVLADSIVIDSAAGQAERLLAHLDRYVIREDVQLADVTGTWRTWLLTGERAHQVLETAAAASLTARCQMLLIGQREVLVARSDYAGPGSFFLHIPQASVEPVCAAILAAGAAPLSAVDVETARVEAGSPLYGIDITEENLPQEIARDSQAISLVKGCYLGQETVARIDALGHVNRLLVGCRFAPGPVPASGTELRAGGKAVGRVTSAVDSPRLAAPLAIAFVRRGHHTIGSRLDSDRGEVEVVAFPGRVS